MLKFLSIDMREYISILLKGGVGVGGAALGAVHFPRFAMGPYFGFVWVPQFHEWTEIFSFISAAAGCLVALFMVANLVLKVYRQILDIRERKVAFKEERE